MSTAPTHWAGRKAAAPSESAETPSNLPCFIKRECCASPPALCTFSAAPHGALAALELHFLELPSAPPPGVSCQKHGLLPAGVGAVNPSAFAGSLRAQIKIGHGLKFSNLTSWYWNQRSHRKGRFACFYADILISAALCFQEHSQKANPFQ